MCVFCVFLPYAVICVFQGRHMFTSLYLNMHPNLSLRGGGITLTSWNVRGLGHAIKRAKVFSHLKSLAADIIFLLVL